MAMTFLRLQNDFVICVNSRRQCKSNTIPPTKASKTRRPTHFEILEMYRFAVAPRETSIVSYVENALPILPVLNRLFGGPELTLRSSRKSMTAKVELASA